jgi:hypothetical protein
MERTQFPLFSMTYSVLQLTGCLLSVILWHLHSYRILLMNMKAEQERYL